jgi:adenylosuccinate lyase
MSHIYTYGVLCPKAKPIIHLGATSCYVGDNTDIIQMKEVKNKKNKEKKSMLLIQKRLLKLISLLRNMAVMYKSIPTLGYTHYQAAQLTTVGKRATLWLQDFYFDLLDLIDVTEKIPLLGCNLFYLKKLGKGTTYII